MGVGLGLGVTALSAAAAWVGIRTGLQEAGLVGVAGWAVGVTGAILGAMTLFGTTSLLFTPTVELEKAAAAAQAPSTVARMPVLVETV